MNIFTFLSGYADGLSAIPDEQLGMLVFSLLSYERDGEGCPPVQMPPSVSLTCSILRQELAKKPKPQYPYLDILADLPTEQMGTLARALFHAVGHGCFDDSCLPPTTRLAYRFICRDIASEQLRREHLRDAGAKGGRTRKKSINTAETEEEKHSLSSAKAELKHSLSSAKAELKHSLSSAKAELKHSLSSASEKPPFLLKKLTKEDDTSLINNNLLEYNNKYTTGGGGGNAHAYTRTRAREACGPAPSPSPPEAFPEEEKDEEGRSCAVSPEGEEIMQFWNAEAARAKARVRRISIITPKRLAAIHARLRDCGGDISILKQVLSKFVASPYANGDNPRAWVASFDWIMVQDNFAKAAEGNYDDRRNATPVAPDMTQAIAASREPPQASKDEELRQRLVGIVRLVERNPNSSARKSLEAYAKNGTLKRLGIKWSETSP